LTDLRDVIAILREDPDGDGDHPQPTLADLPALVAESSASGVRVRVDAGGVDLAAVPATVARAAFRIIQEGLTNVRRHAPGVVAVLALRGRAGDFLTIELTNPCPVGGARPAEPGGGTGLIGLVERAELAGGSLEHGLTPAGAFRLVARLPWPA
jgi:signal transduction histidine kinase